MIKINLLPKELRFQKKKLIPRINLRQVLNFLPHFFIILIILHTFLLGIFLFKNSQLGSLNNKWQGLEPQRKILEDFKKERGALLGDVSIMQELSSRRIQWAEKLNKLSRYLPSGIWFNEITIASREFTLKASAISLQKEEMNLINSFMDNLKNDKDFSGDFTNLELSSVQRRTVAGYEIVDFILAAALK